MYLIAKHLIPLKIMCWVDFYMCLITVWCNAFCFFYSFLYVSRHLGFNKYILNAYGLAQCLLLCCLFKRLLLNVLSILIVVFAFAGGAALSNCPLRFRRTTFTPGALEK